MKKTSECDSKKNTEKENVPEKEIKKRSKLPDTSQ